MLFIILLFHVGICIQYLRLYILTVFNVFSHVVIFIHSLLFVPSNDILSMIEYHSLISIQFVLPLLNFIVVSFPFVCLLIIAEQLGSGIVLFLSNHVLVSTYIVFGIIGVESDISPVIMTVISL